ncbi:branched-chain amino acid ABC transporter permease [Arthrobacter psychrolactophilus]
MWPCASWPDSSLAVPRSGCAATIWPSSRSASARSSASQPTTSTSPEAPPAFTGSPGWNSLAWTVSNPVPFYYFCVVVVGLLVLGSARLGKSRLGRAWRFVREDEDAAEAMGIHTYKVKLAAYIFGAIWGGLGGMLFASHLSAISPQSFVFLQSALVLMAVVLGGMGNTRGVVVGAVVISLLPEFLRDMGNLRYVIFGVVLVAVMACVPRASGPPGRMSLRSTTAATGPGAHGGKRSGRKKLTPAAPANNAGTATGEDA